jgi:hypothetical protein
MKLESSVVSNNTTAIINVNHIKGVAKTMTNYSVIFLDDTFRVYTRLNVDEVFDALRGLPIPGVTLIKV